MAAFSGLALKFVQWFLRGIQFCCAALILAIFSYFLATLHNHNLPIATWIRAVEGISGAAVLYTLTGLLLLCCLAGHPFSSGIAIILDICFAAAFIYVASANRGGAGSCRGTVDTAFGTGNADTNVSDDGNQGFTNLPSFRQACQMQTACLAVAIVALLFFLLSAVVEVALVRHRRKERAFGPSPANDYTSGYGKKHGLFGGFRRKRNTGLSHTSALPQHTHPNQVRDSYATEQTRVGTAGTTTTAGYNNVNGNKLGEPGFGGHHANPLQQQPPLGNAAQYPAHPAIGGGHAGGRLSPRAEYPPANYQYEDGTYNAR